MADKLLVFCLPYKDVAPDYQSIDLAGTVCFKEHGQDASSLVGAEDSESASTDDLTLPVPSLEECFSCVRSWLQELERQSPTTSAPSISSVHRHITNWLGSASIGFDLSGGMDTKGERTAY